MYSTLPLYSFSDSNKIRNLPSQLIAALRTRNWYPKIDPPVVSPNGGLHTNLSALAINVTHPNLNTSFCTGGCELLCIVGSEDKLDPRIRGGARNLTAMNTSSDSLEFMLPSDGYSVVACRVVTSAGEWSALSRYVFAQSQLVSDVIVTEILYNPKNASVAFVELKNVGNTSLHLKGITIHTAITARLPDTYLLPGQFLVLTRNCSALLGIEPNVSCSEHSNKLDRSGSEWLNMRAPDNSSMLLTLKYSSLAPWPDLTNLTGRSIVLRDSSGALRGQSASDWRPSLSFGGSPGREDVLPSVDEPDEPAALADSTLTLAIVIPLAAILLIALIIGGVLLYRRRFGSLESYSSTFLDQKAADNTSSTAVSMQPYKLQRY